MTEIQITDITTGAITGTGVFDKLMASVKVHIAEEFEAGRIKGPDYAQVYLGAMQSVIGQSIEYILREKLVEADVELKNSQKALLDQQKLSEVKNTLKVGYDADIAGTNFYVADNTKAHKVTLSSSDATVAAGTTAHKISSAQYQATKVNNEALYVASQKTALEEQVVDNRKIKALDSLADTYGTFGAGGLTLSANMWSTYFGIVSDLSGASVPSSTTVSKVV